MAISSLEENQNSSAHSFTAWEQTARDDVGLYPALKLDIAAPLLRMLDQTLSMLTEKRGKK